MNRDETRIDKTDIGTIYKSTELNSTAIVNPLDTYDIVIYVENSTDSLRNLI